MAFCNNCGNYLSDNDQACPECGNASLSKAGETVGRNIDRVLRYAEKNIPEAKNQFSSGNSRLISPAMFLVALLCLFMPFVSFSCGGQEITVTGLELATGKTAYGERIEGSGWAVFLIVVLLSGFGLSFWKDQRNYLFSIVAAAVALLTILGIAAGISNEISGQDMMGLVSYELRSGFYLMFMSVLIAGGINVFYFRQPKKTGNKNNILRQDEGRNLESAYSSGWSVGDKGLTISRDTVATKDENPFEDDIFSVESEWEKEITKDKTIEWAGGTYTGQLKKNIPDGVGKLTMPNNAYYDGQWKDGKPNHYGKMTYSNGAKYIGCFLEGKRHGFGVYVKQDGTKVLGEWEMGEHLKRNRKNLYKHLYYIIYEGIYNIPMLAAKLNISENDVFSNVEKIIAAGWLSNAEINTDKKQIFVPGLNHGNDEPGNEFINGMETASTVIPSSDIKNCEKCGGILKQDARFCPDCGFPVENTHVKNSTLDPHDKKTICIACSKLLNSGAEFCSSCGQYQH